MAEENINNELPTNDQTLSTKIPERPQFNNDLQEEPEKKSGIFTLIIGLILIVRGAMRMNQSGAEIFGVIMLVIGLASIIYFVKDRF